MNKLKKIVCFIIIILTTCSVCLITACKNDNSLVTSSSEISSYSEISSDEEMVDTIELTLDNYENYFFIQQETLSTEQTVITSGIYEGYYKIKRSTKFTILLRAEITFNNVSLTIKSKVIRDFNNRIIGWDTVESGILNLSYKGEGFLVIENTSEHTPSSNLNEVLAGLEFVVSSISGSVTLK